MWTFSKQTDANKFKMQLMQILLIITSVVLQQTYCGKIFGRDLATDVTTARSACITLELQSAQFRNSVSVFQADIQNEVTNTGNLIVLKLRDAALPAIEADRLQLLMQNSISTSISASNSLTNDLKNAESAIKKIITSLDGDLGTLGQADRDLRTSIVKVNGTFFDGKANIKSSFDVTEYSVNEAVNSVNIEVAGEVLNLWRDIDDVLLAQQLLLEEEKILFDGSADLAVEALDIVVDQLP